MKITKKSSSSVKSSKTIHPSVEKKGEGRQVRFWRRHRGSLITSPFVVPHKSSPPANCPASADFNSFFFFFFLPPNAVLFLILAAVAGGWRSIGSCQRSRHPSSADSLRSISRQTPAEARGMERNFSLADFRFTGGRGCKVCYKTEKMMRSRACVRAGGGGDACLGDEFQA